MTPLVKKLVAQIDALLEALILGHIGTLAVNPYIYAKLPYDANKDFVPITLVSKVPSLYVVHPDLPVKNLK